MKTVEKKQFRELMQSVLDAGKVLIAPVRRDKLTEFSVISDPSAAVLDLSNTKLSLKEHFLPRTECILKYRREEGQVRLYDAELPKDERVIFGARPCDAASLPILDKVFTWDYKDNFYLARRKNTTIVTIACDAPAPSCLCTSVGLSPSARDGSDILLLPLGGERFGVDVVTEKGEKLLSLWKGKTGEAADAEAKDAASKGAAITGRKVEVEKLREKLKGQFESPAWAELTMKCLGCGVCAYICPTCHCFDIVDEKIGDDGVRLRNWDACGFENFTMHGSGHNPRAAQWQRYRQRLMHKFDYYLEKFGTIACVGCGRCMTACPVGMDIFQVLEGVCSDGK